MNRTLDVATSVFATIARLGAGVVAGEIGPRPEKLLSLYEFEACPFCRKVREALTTFDLDAMIYPCPRGGPRYREEVKQKGGKAQFPYLVDPNTDISMYESDDIVRYLADRYGRGKVPVQLALGPLTTASAMSASLWRPTRGRAYRRAKSPDKPLELYSFESSPFCRLAREALCELEIPYLLHNVGKRSPKREAFEALSGKMMVPYLIDPNTGQAMFESADIIAHLNATYAL
jgi:glutathione S-transferase